MAGALIAAGSPLAAAFAATLALFAVAVAPVAAIARDEVPEHRAEAEDDGFRELAAGFRAVAAQPGLRLVVGVLGLSSLVEGTIVVPPGGRGD